MKLPAVARQVSRVADAVARAWQSVKGDPVLVREATAREVRRRRAHADAYDELLMRRLAERGATVEGLEDDGELPGEEDALIDTALYLAASWENERARRIALRGRAGVAAVALAAAGLAVTLRAGRLRTSGRHRR